MASITLFLIAATILNSYLCIASAVNITSSYTLRPNTTATWRNNDESVSLSTVRYSDNSVARFILLQSTPQYLQFGFCFYCSPAIGNLCYLSVVYAGSLSDDPPKVVWSANRKSPVGENATLTFSSEEGLVLENADGDHIWNVSTLVRPVVGMSLVGEGNVLLLDQLNGVLWQTFDHPTDTLVIGQTLRKGQCLTSGISSENGSLALFRLCVDRTSLTAFAEVEKATPYLSITEFSVQRQFRVTTLKNVTLDSDSLIFFYQNSDSVYALSHQIPELKFTGFLKLDDDGGVRIHHWDPGEGWQAISGVFEGDEECRFPLKCGRYGVCQSGQCSCPVAVDGRQYFQDLSPQMPNIGCHDITASSPQSSYQLVNFGSLSYFSYFDTAAAIPHLETEESCKQACNDDASCKAAFFKFYDNSSEGDCYLPFQILSIMNETSKRSVSYKTSSYIKVITPHDSVSSSRKPEAQPAHTIFHFVPFSVISTSVAISIFALWMFLKWKKGISEISEEYLEKLSHILIRFSKDELSYATGNFTDKIGGGGFGMVFKGTIKDGTLVAVKRLDKIEQGTKEFLAEVEAVGSVHHISVVKLIGFCVEKRHKMLVYEYMSNGSLEKWIFDDRKHITLDWELRTKILLDVAKGLAYLHEDCRQRIAHLDVKPENILLDENFNAKLSDFGMSKFIKRDESRVVTGIRGTVGYLAPEWRQFGITVKADSYSFGVVLLEVISGRKNLDYSLSESDCHLLSLLQKKYLENRLIDIVDCRSEDVQFHREEAVELIKLGMWCLDEDYTRRPSMSLVVKVLEGVTKLPANMSFNLPYVDISPQGSRNVSCSSLRASEIRLKIFHESHNMTMCSESM